MFFDNVTSSCFVPKITLPIRIRDTPSTLIDNVYTNAIDKIHTSGILIWPISDYQMHFYVLNENYAKTNNARRYQNQNQNQKQNNFISETYNVNNIKINLLLMGANSWKPI